MRYFRAENANRLIAGVRFELIEVLGGTMVGVLAAEDPLATTLADLSADARNGIREIDAAAYDKLLKKKAPSLGNLQHSNLSPQEVAIKRLPSGKEALVVPGNEVPKPEASELTVEAALEVKQVNPPSEEGMAPPPRKKRERGTV